MSESASFPRRIEALAEIFAFAARAFERERIPEPLRSDVEFVLEELFTNIVKYGRGRAPVTIDIRAIADGVEATVTEPEAERFDITRAAPVDTTLPAEQRRPGGLGLHLVARLADFVKYDYSEEERCGRVVFRKTGAAPSSCGGTRTGDEPC